MSRLFLFIHIPRTGGTSFRKSCERYFGTNRCIFSYGIKDFTILSPKDKNYCGVTSTILNKWHEDKNKNTIVDYVKKNNIEFIGGHCIDIEDYINAFGEKNINIITFIREPVSRILSWYNLLIKSKTIKENSTLNDFLSNSISHCNILYNKLYKYKNLIKFIGSTRHYESSIKKINKLYKISIENIHENKSIKEIKPSQEIKNMILEKNMLDLKLFKELSMCL